MTNQVQANLSVGDLRCEYLTNPVAIDAATPRFSWKLSSAERGQMQTAYQLQVTRFSGQGVEDPEVLWDSGEVDSSDSLNILYSGPQLESRTCYLWKVRVWDAKGAVSHWSELASFGLGILAGDAWTGDWISSNLEIFEFQKELKKLPKFVMDDREGKKKRHDWIMGHTNSIEEAPGVWMRKEIHIARRPVRATALVSGLGFYELYVNGRKSDDEYFHTAIADYSKTLPYLAHDLSDQIMEGENAVGVLLGNGHFNPVVPFLHREYASDFIETPRLRLELILEYEDGTREVVGSDTSWCFTTDGPIRINSRRSGEVYDARRELGDWSAFGYKDETWSPVIPCEGPKGVPTLQTIPPVRVLEEIPAVSVEPIDGGWRFDIGVQSAGWSRLRVRGKPGQRITVNYPGADNHTVGPYQTCTFICAGGGEEIFEPRFSYNGYQHVEVRGLDYTPKLADCTGLLVASDMAPRGTFECSDERINALQKVHLRTIRNYYIQMPGDPVREKANWTQDIQSHFDSVAYNFDLTHMYGKWQLDFIDHIQDDGFVPAIVPSCFAGYWINGPWWGGMIVYNPWQQYLFYGNIGILARSYPAMKKYLSYLDSIANDHVIEWGLGDWQDALAQKEGYGWPKSTSVSYTSTCAYFLYADILRKTAELLAFDEEAAAFQRRREEIREAILESFFDADSGNYDTGSQTALVLALRLQVAPEEHRSRILELLKERIRADDYHLTSGFVGLPYLLTELAENGLGDLAWTIATQETYPSWYDMVFARNNTAFMEAWDGGYVQMPTLAAPIGAWFYRTLGGIWPTSAGFKSFVIEPYTSTLEWVNCSYDSEYGQIRCDWRKEGDGIAMTIDVPVGAFAELQLPAGKVTESDAPAFEAAGVSELQSRADRVHLRLESGSYNFRMKDVLQF